MKPIEVYPISALLGAAALGLVWIAAGAVQVTSTQQAPSASPTTSIVTAPITIDNPIQVRGIPIGRNMVRIPEGTQFVVPSHRTLVITAVGMSSTPPNQVAEVEIRINGSSVFVVFVDTSNSVQVIPPGLVAAPGSTVEVVTNVTPGVKMLLGFLADA